MDPQVLSLDAPKDVNLREKKIILCKCYECYDSLYDVNDGFGFIQGPANRRFPGCENSAGKARQEW